MIRNDTYNIIHTTNYAALCVAILRPSPVTVEDAFELYEGKGKLTGSGRGGKVDHKLRLQEMVYLRREGYTWPQIGQVMGLKAPDCYFSQHRHLLQEDKDGDNI